MKIKVILITEVISPYRTPIFNEITKELSDEFLVLFFSENVKEREWKVNKELIKFNYKVLPSLSFKMKTDYFPYFFNPTLLWVLFQNRPKIIIIGGYHHPSSFLALLYAKVFKRKIILWCENNKYDQRSQNSLKEAYKRWFIRNCTGYIVPGRASFEYLSLLGVNPIKICFAPNAVDNDYFNQEAEKYRIIKDTIKEKNGFPKKLILYVGRLLDHKGILDLLKAFQSISHEQPDTGLLLVGSGKGEGRYKHFCRMNNIKNVFFEGFIQQEELPCYYAIADVFVLPSHSEPWGLVLNEAMACGLPVVCSDVTGAAPDLVINGVNGYIFEKGNVSELAKYLRDILADGQKRDEMGRKSLEIIQGHSPLRCAQGIIKAVKEI